MRTVHLPYGKTGLDVEVPDSSTVVEPDDPPALSDEEGAVTEALRSPMGGPPLESLVEDRAIKMSSWCSPTSRGRCRTRRCSPRFSPSSSGWERDQSAWSCCARRERTAAPLTPRCPLSSLPNPLPLPSPRPQRHGGRARGRGRRGRHRGAGSTVATWTRTCGSSPVSWNRTSSQGSAEGRKAVCPGSRRPGHHSRGALADAGSRARWPRGPSWRVTRSTTSCRRATELAAPALSLDVTIDRARRLTGVFNGPLPKAHEAACESVLRHSVSSVDGPFDVVLTTNGGYPLDRNLYQAVKGMAAAERVVADGGTIVVAAECVDGLPGGGAFEQLLAGAQDASQLLAGGAALPGSPEQAGTAHPPETPALPDGWQAQVLGRVLSKAEVWLFAGGLDDESVRRAQLRPVRDVGAAVTEALGRRGVGSRLCVLVRGPLAVATTAGNGRDV